MRNLALFLILEAISATHALSAIQLSGAHWSSASSRKKWQISKWQERFSPDYKSLSTDNYLSFQEISKLWNIFNIF